MAKSKPKVALITQPMASGVLLRATFSITNGASERRRISPNWSPSFSTATARALSPGEHRGGWWYDSENDLRGIINCRNCARRIILRTSLLLLLKQGSEKGPI